MLFCFIFFTTSFMRAVETSFLCPFCHFSCFLLTITIKVEGRALFWVWFKTKCLWKSHIFFLFGLVENVSILVLCFDLTSFKLFSQNLLSFSQFLLNNFRIQTFCFKFLSQFQAFDQNFSFFYFTCIHLILFIEFYQSLLKLDYIFI